MTEKSLTDLAALPGEGRTLDAMIAEKVMGYRFPKSGETIYAPEGYGMSRGNVPHYSTDISAAWKVVEKLRVGRNYIDVQVYVGEYACTIVVNTEERHVGQCTERAATAPLAICLAALASRVPENKEGK